MTKPIKVDTAATCPRHCRGGCRGLRTGDVHDASRTRRHHAGAAPVHRRYPDVDALPGVPAWARSSAPGECSAKGGGAQPADDQRQDPGQASTATGSISTARAKWPGRRPLGDLHVEPRQGIHEVFRRDGDNLEMVVKIPMDGGCAGHRGGLAATARGRGLQPIPPSQASCCRCPQARSGTRIALKERGVLVARLGPLGVTLLVQTPTKLNDAQRDPLRRLPICAPRPPPRPACEEAGVGAGSAKPFAGAGVRGRRRRLESTELFGRRSVVVCLPACCVRTDATRRADKA